MLLSEIKKLFKKSLNSLYPKEEIESIFIYAAEDTLNYSKLDLHQNLYKNIQPEAEKKILQILSRLKKGEPIQYITGTAEFYELNFIVDPRVLIPRQETEMLVDILLKENANNKSPGILDLCTGSGCIAIALSKNLPLANVSATDFSVNALELAKINASNNNCEVEFIMDDILNPESSYKNFDIIVSNPPYVRNSEKQFMHANVLNFEPVDALFVEDSDPLIFYRSIALFAQKNLNSSGQLYLEINEKLGKETKKLIENSGFTETRILKDLENKNRFVIAKK